MKCMSQYIRIMSLKMRWPCIWATFGIQTYKYGIKVPRNVEEALEIDKVTSTSFWWLAIEKEMLNVKQAFEFQLDDKPVPVGYKWILLQMIFNVKINFMCKARLVARGHLTHPPTTLIYSSVVSRESVRLAFLIAA